MKIQVPSLTLHSGLRSRHTMSCGVDLRHGLDPSFLWLGLGSVKMDMSKLKEDIENLVEASREM